MQSLDDSEVYDTIIELLKVQTADFVCRRSRVYFRVACNEHYIGQALRGGLFI